MEKEPELKPEFIEKMRKIEKQKTIKIKNWDKHFGLANKDKIVLKKMKETPLIKQFDNGLEDLKFGRIRRVA